uniref:Uncharacterized protein n=1 Tax=Spironucleus salmonicida TaxID=348837 RepID=V6LSH9_9EUKA|eukprot:EST46656.1 hypothetical protein SS50377_13461 [Spironucleus salmonicida]
MLYKPDDGIANVDQTDNLYSQYLSSLKTQEQLYEDVRQLEIQLQQQGKQIILQQDNQIQTEQVIDNEDSALEVTKVKDTIAKQKKHQHNDKKQTKQKQKETMSTQFKLEQVSDGIPSFIITSSKQDKRNLFEENVIINRNQFNKNLANGQSGQNLVNGQSGQNLVNGQSGQNLANGQSGQNLVNGQSGQNLVNGQPGQNLANGQPGQNLVNGQSGQNLANGQSGQNLANGQPGQNLVNGQSGQNLAHGQPGQNLANGQPNTDTNYNNNQLFSPGLTLNDLSTNTKENYCPHTQQVIQYLQTLNQQNLSNDVKQLIKQLYSIACQGKCVQTQTELQVLTNQKIMVSQLLTQSQTSLGSSFFTRSSTMSESEYLKNQKRLKGKLGGSTPQVEGNLDSFVLTSAPSIKKNFQRK